jgi:hypothetical protein
LTPLTSPTNLPGLVHLPFLSLLIRVSQKHRLALLVAPFYLLSIFCDRSF